jgi:hypothetical protein
MNVKIEFSESTEKELKFWRDTLTKDLREKRVEHEAIVDEVDKLTEITEALSTVLLFGNKDISIPAGEDGAHE